MSSSLSHWNTWADPVRVFDVLALSATASVLVYLLFKSALRTGRMPPGPKGLPWIGNRSQLPASKPWRKFTEWNKQYGSVASLFLGRTPVIVLGSAQAAWDLLDARQIYQSRPRFVVAGEILSDNMRGLMLPGGPAWRRWRRVLHAGFHSQKSDTYREVQSLESKILMYQLLHVPTAYERHIKRFSASVVVSVTYGKRIDSIDEWIVQENQASMNYLMSVNIPGKYLVESWPWLLKLPRSLQWFRREPERQRQRDIEFLEFLLNDVKARVADGTCPPCLGSDTYATMDKIGLSELELAYALSTPFGAGIDTTSGVIFTFILAMLHFPHVMRKAQAEIDSIVGFDRMPEFEDKERLRYVCALIDETHRWRPVTPLGGTPHAVTADDEYHGMFIPKGSTVFANFHGIMQNSDIFSSPDAFSPERFLENTDPRLQPFTLPFGFGRRICPGMHLAGNSLFIVVARILWAFEILPAEDGVLPDPDAFTDGFNSWPMSFECQFVPRSHKVKECIEREHETANEALGKWR